jgi:DNA ligase-associated metallophosphoesterase
MARSSVRDGRAGRKASSIRMTMSQPVATSSSPDAPHATATLAGEIVELMAERAIHWPGGRTLFVADVHLGKAAAFRAGGVPIPRGATANDLGRLRALVARTGARRLVVLGDFLHAAAGRVPALDAAFLRWRAEHADLAITLVRGNHDARAGDPPASWAIDVVADPHPLAPFVLCHEPAIPGTGHVLCGHVHPGVRVTAGRESVRLPCFVLGPRRTLLPAFGRLTGLAIVSPAPGETIVAIAGRRLFALHS